MDQDLKEKTQDLLAKAETIVVFVSEPSGFDGLAAGLALYLSLAKLGKNVSIVAPNPSVGDAQRLYAVDKVGQVQGKSNLVVVIDNAIENVDKVTYFLEDGKLKIVIHVLPQGKGVTKDQVSFDQSPVKPNLVFAIGFSSAEELKRKITHEQNLDSETWVISLNRVQLSQDLAQVNIFDPDASLSELTGQLMADLVLPIDEDVAYNLYSGLKSATSNFSLSKSNPRSFQIASMLVKFGAGRASLAKSGTDSVIPQAKGLNYQFAPDFDQKPIDRVEKEGEDKEEDWLKPPKIYKGAKSFDREN